MLVFQNKPLLQTHLHQLKQTLTLAITAGVMMLAKPANALQVRITPDSPKLGETISVIIQTDTSDAKPTVSMRGHNYTAFALNQNSDRYRALLPTSPLDKPGRLVIRVTGEGQTKNLALWLANRSFPTQRIRLSGTGSGSATQLELDRVAAFKRLVTPQKFWTTPFLRPNTGRVSTIFGVRRYYNGVFAQNYYHRGVDYAGSYGSSVIAPASGRVELIGRESEGFRVHGNTVGINHGQGVLSIFLHLSRIDVRQGTFVQAGQRIGAIGSTGASTGPHLHWGLYVNGVAIDPVPWRFQRIE